MKIRNILFICILLIPIALIADYFTAAAVAKYWINPLFPDYDWMGFYIPSVGTIIMATVSISILYIQQKTNISQFRYAQKKDEITRLIYLMTKYVNTFNFDSLYRLSFEWQNNIKSRNQLENDLSKIRNNAEMIWLQLSLEINSKDKVSMEFLTSQSSNFNSLCKIFEDLRMLFFFDSSEIADRCISVNNDLTETYEYLSSFFRRTTFTKDIPDNYGISYEMVKKQVFSYVDSLKSDLNKISNNHG